MKVEWLTIKDGLLYAGGHGVEYRDENGTVTTEDPMWVKIVSPTGEVKSVNWKDKFNKLRDAANCSAPGYLTHEAVQWSEHLQKWVFLPRKASATIYKEKEDERKGTRMLIFASDDFQEIKIVQIGKKNLYPEKGFSAFDFIPETNDTVIVALKSKEIGNLTASFVTVFDVNGKIRMREQKLEDNYKFEGIYFV
ncbi:Apyrase [Oesophagostomum dentatum]|uniref:Apyrase n=1 Tax=Oesophagostomum dentatum TaxID=61180 RepID=A0A0B1SX47_OESDE|nr:Apyrase [Oesophagostomum dentatum]